MPLHRRELLVRPGPGVLFNLPENVDTDDCCRGSTVPYRAPILHLFLLQPLTTYPSLVSALRLAAMMDLPSARFSNVLSIIGTFWI